MEQTTIAAAYIRVSTDDQTELSPDAQIREIRKAAEADGCVLPAELIFMEKKGISGRRAENRPEFQRMIAMAKQTPPPFSRLYLWKFSRFARNQDESTFYKGILRKKCGVEIISVSEPIAQGMFGRLIETIIEWFDEYYSYNLSGEVTRGMTEKALQKGYQLSPCLGYRAVGGGRPFIIKEDEYGIVEKIFHMYGVEKLDKTKIARQLNAEGFRTKRGLLFDQRSIHRILTNRFYIGEVHWNDISFQGQHEIRPSVSELFDICQERLEREFAPAKRRNISVCRHWLSGLLKCGECGAAMSYNTGGSSRPCPVFTCWRYAKGLHRQSCSVTVKKAERAVLRSLEEILLTDDASYQYIPIKPVENRQSHLTLLEEQLKKLELREERLRAAYELGVDTLEEYQAGRQRISREKTEIQNELSQSHGNANEKTAPTREAVLSQIETIHDLLSNPDVDYEIKGNALRSVIKYITFDRKEDRFEVHYYL